MTNIMIEQNLFIGDKVLGSKLKGRGDSGGRKFLPAVSTSLALAAGIGLAEALGLFLGSGLLINIMGIPVVCQNMLIIHKILLIALVLIIWFNLPKHALSKDYIFYFNFLLLMSHCPASNG